MGADLRYRWRVLAADLEIRSSRLRTLDEQRHRLAVGEPSRCRRVARVRQSEWRDRELVLTGEAQRHSTGHQHFQAGCASQELPDLRRGRDDLLEVVEHEQELPVTYGVFEGLQRCARPGFADAQHLGNGGRDQRRISDRRQIDEPNTIREAIQQRGGEREGQARFAGAAGARQREQPHVIPQESTANGGEFPLAPDKRGRRHRQVVAWLTLSDHCGLRASPASYHPSASLPSRPSVAPQVRDDAAIEPVGSLGHLLISSRVSRSPTVR